MATTALSSIIAAHSPKTELRTSTSLHKSPYLSGSKISKAPLPQLKPRAAGPRTSGRCFAKKSPLDNIPKRFREENLKDGLAENFKNVPDYLYGLSASQIDMFMTEDSPVHRQAEKVTEESISSARNYLDNGEMYSFSGRGAGRFSMMSSGVSMYRGGGGGRGPRGPRSSPPDLPSLLLDSRIVYLGMPIVPAVTELLLAEFLWLDHDDDTKPIYLYINSTGTRNEKNETVGSETDAFAIADAMNLCKADVYTINIGSAAGQAAMLLAIGKKGKRGLQPHAVTKLYKPKVYRSSGAAIDTWIQAKELDVLSDYYLQLLSDGIGKPKEEISRDIDRGKFFTAEKAVEYGIADRIMEPMDPAFEKKNYDELLAKSRAMQQKRPANAAGVGAQPGW